MIQIPIKRGETFALARNLADDGIAGAIDDYEMRSQLRQDGTLVADLTITPDDGQEENPGDYVLSASDPTDEWPLGRCLFDVEYTDTDGAVKKGETVAVYVLSSPTHAAEEIET